MTYVGKSPADIIATAVDTTTGTFSGDLTVDTNTLYVDSANNSVGIGTTDIVNNSIYNSLRLGSAGNLQAYTSTSNGNIFIAEGAAINSAGNWEYLRSDFATYYRQGDGTHIWASAPSGSDGNTVSFSESMRIDTSGNLLVGKTSPAIGTAGFEALASGNTLATRNNGVVMSLNRLSSDGTILDIRKDGSNVGSIGVSGTRMHLLNGDTGLRFAGDTNSIFPCTTAGADSNNAIDLGASGNRFKDFYLGGGIYLGGTGSANKLDDYEEGTFIATLTPASGSFTMETTRDLLRYTKIGRVVTVSGYVRPSSVSSASGIITFTLPFTSANTAEFDGHSVGVAMPENLASGNSNEFKIRVPRNSATAEILHTAGGGDYANWSAVAQKFQAFTNVTIQITYTTDS